MLMTNFVPISSFNRKALIGFIAALFAILALCIGLLPIPLTALICYPPGLILAITSFALGILALRELHTNPQNGRSLALFATWAGGFTILLTICFIATGVLLYPYISQVFQQLINQAQP